MANVTFARVSASTPIIDDEVRGAIAELLLAGAAPAEVAERLAGRGFVPDMLAAEIARAAKSPYLRAGERLQARLAKRDWVLANNARLERLRGEAVPRHHRLDATRFFDEFYCTNRPVLVTGLVDHWPALGWNFETLAARFGAAEIDVQWNREANPLYEVEADRHNARQPFDAVVRRITTGGPSNDFYVTANNSAHNKQVLGSLWDDIGTMPGWLEPREARDGFFWMGPRGTITPFHHDLTNNLLVQIAGTKRVKLVSAAETPRMRNDRHCFSAWRGEDLPAGPGTAERPPVSEVLLQPGEALFLPIGCWHHVEALTPTIGLSFINFARDNDFYSHYRSYGPL